MRLQGKYVQPVVMGVPSELCTSAESCTRLKASLYTSVFWMTLMAKK